MNGDAVGRPRMGPLTEALRFFSAPVSVALTRQHCGQGQLVTLVTGVADAGAPGEVRTDHLSIWDGGRLTAHNCCQKWGRVCVMTRSYC